MGAVANLILIVIIVIIVVAFWPKISDLIQLGSSYITGPQQKFNFTFPNSIVQNTTKGDVPQNSSTSPISENVSYGPIINYTLGLINKDRATYGLSPVTLSPILSAQQHSDSMLQYDYFSHWDTYGMKPYMRYSLLGGTESVQENVAYTKSGVTTCIGTSCSSYGNINVSDAVKNMEYSMMYNDSACCNNGHRDNILDPYHNQVSIGVSYNSTSVYLVEDFINNYIAWTNNTPIFINNEVYLKGNTYDNYKLTTVELTYDPQVSNMSTQQLDNTSEYSYGNLIAAVAPNPSDYYPNLTTIDADEYNTNGNSFTVAFNISKQISTYGAGEYTVIALLNGTAPNSTIPSGTYVIFINSAGKEYAPSNA